ncbi:hypothetical protein [Streptomyces sp. NPDC097619]|uniref:hypothetical protein n=1 Tax=Streptomyces sp. NPDC097619 TaxID=3157228 RepID=UPI00332C7621
MDTKVPAEARLDDTRHLLVARASLPDGDPPEVVRDFFGTVITPEESASGPYDLTGKTVYLYGDPVEAAEGRLRSAERVLVVGDPADDHPHGTPGPTAWTRVDAGRVPRRVHGVGVYYPRFFAPEEDHFARIRAEHAFQSLTESTKPGTAHRSGIYLTPVTRDADGLHFRLLRCSTNFTGPTEGFGPTDARIVDALRHEAAAVFHEGAAPLNHVLAQIYHNTAATEGRRQSKARISSHADKTKDMPVGGIMAFCTFYDGLDALRPLPGDPFDLGVKSTSGLTRLHFRLKDGAREESGLGAPLPERFALTLHPGSVFLMPLSTNRLYTHEIRPSTLEAGLLPTRLGYVVRCSKTEAVHRDGRTHLKSADGRTVPLAPPTEAGMADLRRLYAEENTSAAPVDYGDRFRFSMNSGDYRAPRP